MDHHRQEQDKLTASMVSMARALKESSQRFSSALREDQDVLAAAGRGLERSERGLDGVAGRMGSLRRLTEGQGWWGRVLLYAWIAGLALAAVLLLCRPALCVTLSMALPRSALGIGMTFGVTLSLSLS